MDAKKQILSPRILLVIIITVALSFFTLMPLYYLLKNQYEMSLLLFTMGIICVIVVFALKNEISRDLRLYVLVSMQMLGLLVPTLFGVGTPHTYSALAAGLIITGLVLNEKIARVNSITTAILVIVITVFNRHFIPGYDYQSLSTGMVFVIISCIASYLFVAVVSTKIKELEQKNIEIAQMLETLKQYTDQAKTPTEQNNMVNDIKAISSTLTVSTENMLSAVSDLTESSNRQAGVVEQIARAFSEVASNSKKSVKNTQKIKDLSASSKEKLRAGRGQMQMMTIAMEDIAKASSEIKKIMNSIEDIAFQTNVIANTANNDIVSIANREKNIAKMAQEMHSLAKLSTEVVINTQTMINNTLKAVENGKAIVNKSAEYMDKIIINVEDIAMIIEKINVSSNEQFEAITNMEKSLLNISAVISKNSAKASKTNEAVNEVSLRVKKLQARVAV